MITERISQTSELTPGEKLILAGELWRDATDLSSIDPDPKIVELLRQRLEEYRRNPDDVSTWDEVKQRILASNDA